MNNRPIGVFDSGLGGLTCIPYLMKNLPNERVVYFGDTARTPYGSKAESNIIKFSRQITDFLVSQDVKMIVIACNTVSAICLEDLRARHKDIPIVGIIEPTAHFVAEEYSTNNSIGIIGTKVTVNSHSYKNQIESDKPGITVKEQACPAFVPLIEEGIIDNPIMDLTIRHYLDDFIEGNVFDALVIGCTHYPLIEKNIKTIYPELNIINPSKIVVDRIQDVLNKNDDLAEYEEDKPESLFYASDLSDNFLAMIEKIFEDAPHSEGKVIFKNLDI